MTTHEKEFNAELDDYLHSTQTNKKDNSDNETWTFDETTGVYVMHGKRKVMYTTADNQWVCGDYDAIYNDSNDRYLFDTQTQTWYDTVTKEHSIYDDATHTWTLLTDAYWSGQPEGTQSIRFVVASSPHFDTGSVVIADENGITIGRDRSWDSRLRLPEMIVSKYHAMIFLDKKQKRFYIIDNGSQHGTYVNEKRLSEPKQSSLPYELRHGDIVRIGSTSLEVHEHTTMPCDVCRTNSPVDIHSGKKPKQENVSISIVERDEQRRQWIEEAKKMYRSGSVLPDNKDYVDRAELRRQTKVKQEKFVDPYRKEIDETYTPPPQTTTMTTVYKPVQGIGNKMLQKMGWEEGQSLGKDQTTGILEPIQPSSQLSKAGLGSRKHYYKEPLPNETRKGKQWRQARERFEHLI